MQSLKLSLRTSKATVTKTDIVVEEINASQPLHVCLVCARNAASYRCPRCFKPYCSSSCFKNHDYNCTEIFYKDRVSTILNLESHEKLQDHINENNQSLKSKLTHSLDAIHDEREHNILDHLAALAEDPEAFENYNFTPEEMKVLQRVLIAKDVESMIQSWRPWWESDAPSDLVEEVFYSTNNEYNNNIDIHEESNGNCTILHNPQRLRFDIENIRKHAPVFSSLITTPPSPLLRFHLLALLLGYVVMVRSIMGHWGPATETMELGTTPEEALSLLLASSSIMNSRIQYNSVTDAITAWLSCTLPTLSVKTTKAISPLLNDVLKILIRPERVIYVILDTWLLTCVVNGVFTASETTSISCGSSPNPEKTLPLLEAYIPLFVQHPLTKSERSSETNKFARKTFYLLLFLLEQSRDSSILTELSLEMNRYMDMI
eukprot:gene6179-12514_t